ncbi:DnaB-like helicase C-terminal domain-containing protein [Candidatus Phytoplasma prunorum]|uniref:DnaB-like helicase C-terminal domain-containing protein n=1 Tax=Candidatus Phytoplasma prunorum TaxID=47565 RepID=UPI002FEEE9E2
MLTNEQQALNQMVAFISQGKRSQLQIYLNIVAEKHLFDPINQKIFQALKYLFVEKCSHGDNQLEITPTQIREKLLIYLQTNYPQDRFTPTTLNFLIPNLAQAPNLHFLEHLKHTYTQKTLFQELLKIIRPTLEPNPYQEHLYYREIFTKLRTFMTLIPHNADQDLLTINQMATLHPEIAATDLQAQQEIQAEYYQLSDQFLGLNHTTHGFKKGQVITIGGYTGLGKTSFVYNLLLDITQAKFQTSNYHPYMVVFSYEMTLVENLSRLYANFTQIPLDVLLNKKFAVAKMTVTEYQTSMQTAQAFFAKINLSFSYDRSKNITYILDLIYRLHLEQKVEIVVIDHLQITKATNNFDNDRLAIDEIMTKLKQLAIELNLVIIILSQFSRDSYNTHQGKAP